MSNKQSKKMHNINSSYVTINDYANATHISNRVRKNIIARDVVHQVKQLSVSDNKPLETKLADLESCSEKDLTKKNPPNSKKLNQKEGEQETLDEGIDYPIDVYFLISEHIMPESVGVFAALCSTSLAVVSTAKFWFSLYKRFYKETPDTPPYLRPHYVTRLCGLRAQVIRSLHLTYFHRKSNQNDVAGLLRRICVLTYSRRTAKSLWIYCFKMKKQSSKQIKQKKSRKALEILDDIQINPDEGCKMLQVKTPHYCPVPMITGQMLSYAVFTLSRDMATFRLQLDFQSGPTAYHMTSVHFDDVKSAQILDWWDPLFPPSKPFNEELLANAPPLCDTDF